MKVRLILVCTLLLLAAVPTFALPQCKECTAWNTCEPTPGSIETCKYDQNGQCYQDFDRCSIPRAATVLTEWNVASIEISRPSLETITITAPAVRAEVSAPKPEPADVK